MFELSKILTTIILSPFNVLLLWLFSLFCFYIKWEKTAIFSTFLGLSILYIFSIPFTSKILHESLIKEDKLSLQEYRSAQAIVLLGGGLRESKELFANLATNQIALERVRYAAFLQKESQLPLLITGSSSKGSSEAKVMAQELQMFYQVPTTWLEEKAKTTKENAIYSHKILEERGIERIVLVTNQWHMQRAKMLFEQQGFEVLPASVGAGSTPETYGMSIMLFIPQAGAMSTNMIAIKEWLGYWKELL